MDRQSGTQDAVGVRVVTSNSYPRASLVIIAFNQKDYIEEAVSCALAQDYPNLQIVLSDDNSTDDTFDRMQAMVAAYDGSHTVVLNRAPGGRGVLAHFYDALPHVDGVLMIGGAGDDMSAPNRVTKLVEAWRDTGAAAIYSAWNRVDARGKFIATEGIESQHDRDMAAYFPDREVTISFGCTAAYETGFVRSIPLPDKTIWSEDYFWSAIAMLAGRDILYLSEPLVSYRQNPSALRNFVPGKVDHLSYELRENRFFTGLAELLEAVLAVIDNGTPAARTRIDRNAILHDIAWYRYRADWSQRSLFERLYYTATLRSRQRIRWAVPRLPGIRTFIGIKTAMSGFRRNL